MSENTKPQAKAKKSRSGTSRADMPWNGASTQLATAVGGAQEEARNDTLMGILKAQSHVKELERRHPEQRVEWKAILVSTEKAWSHVCQQEWGKATTHLLHAIKVLERQQKTLR
jgi:hypothetical protein